MKKVKNYERIEELREQYATVQAQLKQYVALDTTDRFTFEYDYITLLANRKHIVQELMKIQSEDPTDALDEFLFEDDFDISTEEDHVDVAEFTKDRYGVDIVLCDMYQPSDCEGCCDEIE